DAQAHGKRGRGRGCAIPVWPRGRAGVLRALRLAHGGGAFSTQDRSQDSSLALEHETLGAVSCHPPRREAASVVGNLRARKGIGPADAFFCLGCVSRGVWSANLGWEVRLPGRPLLARQPTVHYLARSAALLIGAFGGAALRLPLIQYGRAARGPLRPTLPRLEDGRVRLRFLLARLAALRSAYRLSSTAGAARGPLRPTLPRLEDGRVRLRFLLARSAALRSAYRLSSTAGAARG